MRHYWERLKKVVHENKKKVIAIGSTAGAAVLLIAGTVTFAALNAGGGLEVVSSGTDPVSGTLSVSSAEIPESTQTIQNEDGTTTVVEQYADGTVKEVTRQKDGTTKEVTTAKDGTITEVTTNKDGSTTQTTTKPNGETQTVTKPSGGNGGSTAQQPSKPSGNSSSSKPSSSGNPASSQPSNSSSPAPSKPESTPSKPSDGGNTSSTPKPPVSSEPEDTLPVEPPDPVWRYTEAEIQQMIQSGIQYGQSIGMTYWAEMSIDNSSWGQPWDEFMGMSPLEAIKECITLYKAQGITDFGLAYRWDTSNGVGVWQVYILY